jgi:hypothetical protein
MSAGRQLVFIAKERSGAEQRGMSSKLVPDLKFQ